VTIPALCMAGDRDFVAAVNSQSIAKQSAMVPKLRPAIMLAGYGHWTEQEHAPEVSAAMIDSFGALGEDENADIGERQDGCRLGCHRFLRSLRRGVTPSSAALCESLRCWATLRNASTPSRPPCRTVKFCFMARRHYRE
jgi:hypothetical protein